MTWGGNGAANCAGVGLFISPELRGGGGLGGKRERELVLSGVGAANVCVRFGGGINLLFVSAIDGGGRKVSMDRLTGGSGSEGLFITILFRKSASGRR